MARCNGLFIIRHKVTKELQVFNGNSVWYSKSAASGVANMFLQNHYRNMYWKEHQTYRGYKPKTFEELHPDLEIIDLKAEMIEKGIICE